ncbi:beta-ketoacyl-[acyl-carrier-protein] synthase family protein [Nocardia arthritidis]|uniref:Beta-ketoacyl-ACP synthase II n=1 Tax=Nocardia arthritidis TaxID=228602 RepID=A0A6G9YDS4_9NOCA|nr:beta-ketoacyl-[acyl-carrier-protein] synthase family protein [Nocardia arthritidis]QIS11280.1 beta-ketoacyl-ACP synthase II [Nocardia arthritidis]
MESRVVITGMGVLAPGGVGVNEFWKLLGDGRTATRRITLFDPAPFRSQVAAEIDFVPAEHGLTEEDASRLDRATQLALAAVREALGSGRTFDPHRTGVTIGTAVGATMGLEREYRVVSTEGRDWLVDHRLAVGHLYDYFVPSSIAAEVARRTGARGPVEIVSTGCTSGIDAVAHAAELIRDGMADTMIAGATDAPLSPITTACFDAIKATTPRNDDPEHASRPFDRTRNGFVLGEGAAIFVLEKYDSARARGAEILAELAGYGSRCNAFHMTGLRPDGREMAAAIRTALDRARVDPGDIDYISAHGSGTKQNDLHETNAVKRVFGARAYDVPMSSIKSMIGHSLGAIGSLEIAACVLAIGDNVVPPTANLREPDPDCDLDYVPVTAREWRTDVVLTVGSGFGGFQSAMVLRAPGRR